jgi:hypothetical protein
VTVVRRGRVLLLFEQARELCFSLGPALEHEQHASQRLAVGRSAAVEFGPCQRMSVPAKRYPD